MILFFLIIPYLWLCLLDIRSSFKEKILYGNCIFWVIITPIIWLLNRLFGILVTPKLFWFLIILITIFLLVWRLKNKNKIKFSWPRVNWDWSLVIVLMVYGILHLLFYGFYVTMPESDGYINILKIEKMMETGNIDYQYRPLFYVAMTVLGQVTKIDMYQVHIFWMVALSVIYLVVISLLIDKSNIKNFWLKLLILLSGLAVPVINMEIDFFRPQSLYLILFPVIFLLEQKNKNYLALLVSLISLGYHQFFVFPVIILGLKIFLGFKKKYKLGIIILVLLALVLFYEKIIFYLPINRIFENIGQINKWRWWFLNSYQTVPDNVEMGWPGFSGALKYYSYYFGPLILGFLLLITFNFKKLINQKFWLFLIVFLFIVSEVLPRLNVVYLPERFPVLIDIMILLLIPSLLQKIKINKILLFSLILVGVLGSIYIARSKGSLTNRQELVATNWIKNNTPDDAIFLTQEGNEAMVKFFARRKFLNPGKDFFNGDIRGDYLKDCKNCYILYSFQKFNGLKSERGYWDEYNYKGVNLDNFSIFKQVYNNDGIIIWEV